MAHQQAETTDERAVVGRGRSHDVQSGVAAFRVADAVRRYGDHWNTRVFAQLVSDGQYARASTWSKLVDMPRDQTRDELRMGYCTKSGRLWQVDE